MQYWQLDSSSSTRLLSLALILTAGCLITCISGCNKSAGGSGGPRVITLEKSDTMYTFNGEPEMPRFDGVYPSGWPEWLRLPANSYLFRKGNIVTKPIHPTPVSQGPMLIAFGVSLIPADQAMKAFQQQLDENNITWKPGSGQGWIEAFDPTPAIGLIEIMVDSAESNEFFTVQYKSRIQVRVYMKQ